MSDQRTEARNLLTERVDLEIIAESAPGEVTTNVVTCKTLDVSTGGLRLAMNQSVPVGTIMNMTVLVDGGQRRFYLTAEIRWIRPSSESGWFLAGFEIYDTEFSDSAAWRYFVQKTTTKR